MPEIEAGLMEKDITPQAAYLEVGVRSEGASTDEETVEPILSVRHLVKEFPVRSSGVVRRVIGKVQAVSDIGFDLRPGETLGLVGESGCGKSTTGRTLLRLTEPTGGIVMFEGEDLAKLKPAQLRKARRDLQIVFQDPYASLNPRLPVNDTVSEPLDIHGLHKGTAQGAGARAAQDRGPQPRARQPLPARVLRAASASASASPGPWPSSRRCSCSTSRCRPSTCPSRPAW